MRAILLLTDDGAGTFEESLAMVHLAAQTGTSSRLLTPIPSSHSGPEVGKKSCRRCGRPRPGLIRIRSGCDFHLHYDNIQDALARGKYTIAHRSYLLVEFSERFVTSQIDAVIGKMLSGGIVPIITHPERNFALQQRLVALNRWVEAGAVSGEGAGVSRSCC